MLGFSLLRRPGWRRTNSDSSTMIQQMETMRQQQKIQDEHMQKKMISLTVISSCSKIGFETVEETSVAIGTAMEKPGVYVLDQVRKQRVIDFYDGYKLVQVWLSRSEIPYLTVSGVKLLHSTILKHPSVAGAESGIYRKERAWGVQPDSSSSERIRPEMIKNEMEWLIGATNTCLEEIYHNRSLDFAERLIKLAARFFLEFESIRPFGDANGRVGRLLLCYLVSGITADFPCTMLLDGSDQINEGSLIGRKEWRSILIRASNADLTKVSPIVGSKYSSVLKRAGAGGDPGELAALIAEGIYVGWRFMD